MELFKYLLNDMLESRDIDYICESVKLPFKLHFNKMQRGFIYDKCVEKINDSVKYVALEI